MRDMMLYTTKMPWKQTLKSSVADLVWKPPSSSSVPGEIVLKKLKLPRTKQHVFFLYSNTVRTVSVTSCPNLPVSCNYMLVSCCKIPQNVCFITSGFPKKPCDSSHHIDTSDDTHLCLQTDDRIIWSGLQEENLFCRHVAALGSGLIGLQK